MREAECVHITGAKTCDIIQFPQPARRRSMLGMGDALLALGRAEAAELSGSPARGPDAELVQLLATFDDLERQIEALSASASITYIRDEDARDAAAAVLQGLQAPLLERALSLRARSASGWRAWARTLQVWDRRLTDIIVSDAGEHWSTRMLAALVRDLTAGAA